MSLINTTAGAGTAASKEGQTIDTFLGSLGASAGVFGLQILLFYSLRAKFTRIYRPKTYLVPEKDRTKPPPAGLFKWIVPLFNTPNAEVISKCGLDSYFFLRYLRMLLKIFLPSAVLILAVLIPINEGGDNAGITGLDKLGWTNYNRDNTNRFWAHLVLAVLFLFYIFYIIYDELRGYIRVRQAYLTSPQHRLRASATTVLLRSVPRKWLTVEALEGLFDVFPGGIRNIWINRDFDELNDKVKLRDKLASKLEDAETALIRKAKKAHMGMQKKAMKSLSKPERKRREDAADAAAQDMANSDGISAGNPHQAHTLDEALECREQSPAGHGHLKLAAPFGQGYNAVRGGIGFVGQGITGFGKKVAQDVRGMPRRLNDKPGHDFGTGRFSYDGQPLVDPEEQERGRTRTPEPATAASTDLPAPWLSPKSATSGSTFGEQQMPAAAADGIAQRDYALPEATAPAVSASSLPGLDRTIKSEDSARTAVDYAAATTRPKGTATSSRRQAPPSASDWTSWGFDAEDQATDKKRNWKSWKRGHNIGLPSPEPNKGDTFGDEVAPVRSLHGSIGTEPTLLQKLVGYLTFSKPKTADDGASIREEYADAYDARYMDDQGMDGEPEWRKYLKPGDRDTMRLPLFGLSFMPFLPSWLLLGSKVDTIYYCRKEVARLNLEIETDQKEPEKFPLMNSAFIQFNHQVAAHMACQSVAHHMPNTMVPRIVEIAPGDVLWDNMSIGYKQRLVRSCLVVAIIAGMIILWAVPVSITGAFSNLDNVANTWSAFQFLTTLPTWVLNLLQGIVPPVLLMVLLALLPIILRFLSNFKGVPTGMTVELDVQWYYFVFLFVQVFLVVTVSTSLLSVVQEISEQPQQAAIILATNVPKAANYFFSYLILQALSVSSGALAQVVQLAVWFLWRPIADNTARQKFSRQLNLQSIQWGTFFPVYTNLACIGMIYSIISPLVMVFNIISFALFWITYRYQILYVNKYRFDTGGLLFPRAVNQLFVGLYVMELALIGLFLLVRGETTGGDVVCLPQAIVMIVMLFVTAFFHTLINFNFAPLFRYMPITLEDDAVRRDEEFERVQAKKWGLSHDDDESEEKERDVDIEENLKAQEQHEQSQEKNAEAIEMQQFKKANRFGSAVSKVGTHLIPVGTWADRSRSRKNSPMDQGSQNPEAIDEIEERRKRRRMSRAAHRLSAPLNFSISDHDAETGGQPGLAGTRASTKRIDHTAAVGDALFGAFSDEIEDLTPEERDTLVQRAFQHAAIRAKRLVIWLPRDDLGVSDDEIRRMQAFGLGNIWVSNEGTGLDRKGRVMFRRAPPDFNEVDLIEL